MKPVSLSPFYKWEDWGSGVQLFGFTWADLGLGPRCLCFQSSLAVTILSCGGLIWWQQHRNPHRGQAKTTPTPHPHPVLQGLYLELETELSQFVSFWYKASCCFPGGHVRTTALMLIAKNCPAGRKQRASCHLPDPLEERVLFTAQKVPPERLALCFFSIPVTLATCKFSGYCSWCWIWGNLPLCWERERETRLSQSWLSVCARAEHRFPHCYLGKRESRC